MHWLLPSGVLRCLSPRELQRATAADFGDAESAETYRDVAAAFGYEYLGGRCEVTELLATPGTLASGAGPSSRGSSLKPR